ncbi:HNH endonuclease [Ectobacillus funiculus]|uniref:HNH endonuclease n=1 Tax=Ectobacillus funiculus TaxID=137993 RepID=UPI00101CDBBB|nr:HNH endonuclease [Ectobacillus funiculus]
MNYFFVFQNKTYLKEKAGSYLWAPKRNKNGNRVSHWDRMLEVKKSDLIIHSYLKKIVAISIASSNAYSAYQPEELQKEKLWEDEGWRVDTKYYEIKKPIITSDHMKKIRELQPSHNAPFNSIGRGNTGYLFSANKELAKYILIQTELSQEDEISKNEINKIREQFGLLNLNETELLDDFGLVDLVEKLEIEDNEEVSYTRVPKEKLSLKTNDKGVPTYPRNLKIAMNALKLARFKCEFDNSHNTFIRKRDGKPYTEPHHLIPLSFHGDFPYSLDVEQNIISLCSHCHNLLHYGRDNSGVLEKLYNDRKDLLKEVGIEIRFEQLLSYY